jgi:hypothetical protein
VLRTGRRCLNHYLVPFLTSQPSETESRLTLFRDSGSLFGRGFPLRLGVAPDHERGFGADVATSRRNTEASAGQSVAHR